MAFIAFFPRVCVFFASLFSPKIRAASDVRQPDSESGLPQGHQQENGHLPTVADMQRSGNRDTNVNNGNNDSSDSTTSGDNDNSDSESSQQWTSATSEQPRIPKHGPDISVADTIGPSTGSLKHVGSIFGDSLSNHDVSVHDPDCLTIPNAALLNGSHLVKDTPNIRYTHRSILISTSDLSDSYQIEGTQSTKSFARSTVSFRRGSNREFQTLLMSSRMRNPHMDRKFYPCGVFDTIITKECVTQQLKTEFPDEDEETIAMMARQILDNTGICEHGSENGMEEGNVPKVSCFRRIFVLLSMLDKMKAVRDFMASGVDDSFLPLKLFSEKEAIYLCPRAEPCKPIQFISDTWLPGDIENFYANQWTTIAPIFLKSKSHKSVLHYKLSRHDILPFIHVDGTALQNHEGGTADVSRVFIHDDHHRFGKRKGFTGSFAVKRLRSCSHIAFKNEVDMLKKFSDDGAYPHLISLLVTFEQNDQYYLLFDWAEHNLKGYWEQVQPHPSATDRGTVLWIGEQCKGIARGIVNLHQYKTTSRSLNNLPAQVIFGHHGDIKEENILWFPGTQGPPDNPNRGVLKLADFGLAKFSEHNTRSLGPSVNFSATPSYRSPESDLQKNQGRSYDIWTLGILYLQTITWLLGGWPLLQEFRMKRKCPDPGWLNCEIDTFFELDPAVEETGKKRHIIKPVVTRFIDELHHNKSCTAFLHEFLKLIAEQMLIVQEPEKIRIGAMKLHAELNKMMLKCKDEANNYASTADPWK